MKKEGDFSDPETLAILLAVGTKIDPMPGSRLEMLAIWQERDESVRVAYRLRARRLLQTWGIE